MKVADNFDEEADVLVSFGADFLETWLSPVEYAWFVELTLLALKYAEAPDAPDGLKDLRRDMDDLRVRRGGRRVELDRCSAGKPPRGRAGRGRPGAAGPGRDR